MKELLSMESLTERKNKLYSMKKVYKRCQKSKMTLEEIAECVPLLSFDEFKGI